MLGVLAVHTMSIYDAQLNDWTVAFLSCLPSTLPCMRCGFFFKRADSALLEDRAGIQSFRWDQPFISLPGSICESAHKREYRLHI
ncbi:hypothetical protein Bcoa_0654 [Heyndrickxia coagulans 36D1]|uniref:Uncharacterized protein n=2 Tax=Heyndrickxia coagulans TaxID=1398 RepID=G2TQM5_HEYCO|nr:hypothetical protein Bcoa_0654 [Heyndrickxia coagulans 36D1]KWZ82725.1 hypothetical protein HMPREF3213_01667 [Heyndrickxia coagulans]